MSNCYALDLMGKTLHDLAPLVLAAVTALDKPGTRGLRRKLDGEFHFLVGHYGALRRLNAPESEWDALRAILPHYERVTEVWPGRAAFEARKAKAETVPAVPVQGHSLRLVVANGHRVEAVELPPTLGGAA